MKSDMTDGNYLDSVILVLSQSETYVDLVVLLLCIIIITGSAVALHCCKAHSKINRKMGNLTPCKIVTPKNFNLKLCIRDYVGEATHHANFGSDRYSGGFSPYRRNITTL